ncbi:VOC family protein [Streptomyces sp. NBC_00448]|uniref:VOC family protein n=1 Tax=Streptomyces sp. NBC_00448 TaxID=2903652 RepID=UPI002E1F0BF5
MSVGIFAGIAVRDYARALGWYQRLFGAEPAPFPNDVEAVWRLADERYVYIVEEAERASGAVSMVWVDEPRSEIARIAGRGLEPVEVEEHGGVCKWVFRDDDGNETGIGGEIPS